MDMSERIYRGIEKHAVKICFVLAVILAALITTGVYFRVDAAAQEKLQEMGEKGHRFILENYEYDVLAQKFIDVFESPFQAKK